MKAGHQVERVAPNAFFCGKRVGGNTLHLGLILLLAASASAAEIRVTGSDLLGEGFVRAVATYAKENDTAVQLDLRGTRLGVEALEAGRADVGIFLLPPGEKPPAGALTSRVMGYRVSVVAVPAVSPLTQATAAQLRGMFGESAKDGFARWGDLNLSGEWAARPIALRAVSGRDALAWSLFQRVILQEARPRAAVEFSPSGEALVQRLLAADNGIGVAGMNATANRGLRALALAASPSEPAYAPTAENVHAGHYPLRMGFYVVFRRAAAAQLQGFLKFLLADETAAVLAPGDYLPLPVGVRNQLVFELEEMR